jgi:hypothetical protein
MTTNTTPDALDQAFAELEDYTPPPARQRVVTKATWFLLFGMTAAAAFAGGVLLQKSRGATTVATANGGRNGAATVGPSTTVAGLGGSAAAGATTVPGAPAAAGGQASAAGGLVGQAGAAATGQIKLIDGTVVYVQDSSGNVIRITTQKDLVVNVTKIGAITDLKVGDAVVVRGTTDADGTVAATAISSGNGQGAGRGNRGGTGWQQRSGRGCGRQHSSEQPSRRPATRRLIPRFLWAATWTSRVWSHPFVTTADSSWKGPTGVPPEGSVRTTAPAAGPRAIAEAQHGRLHVRTAAPSSRWWPRQHRASLRRRGRMRH